MINSSFLEPSLWIANSTERVKWLLQIWAINIIRMSSADRY
ncbi:MAG: hypothetical protein RIT35_1286, partial [Pseudomonadota bacterium]